MTPTRTDYIVKPVHKALKVLDVLAMSQSELGLAEICSRAQVPRTTAYKYLQTLANARYVVYDSQAETYRLGLHVFELGQKVMEQLDVQRVSAPILTSLRNRFDETVNLGVLDNKEVLCIASLNSSQSLQMQTPPGTREGVHATSLGKAMLAFLPEAKWDLFLKGKLKAYTAKTVTDVAAIKAELKRTRERGYAVDNQETTEGAYCVGAPVFNHSGDVEAGISVSAPVSRITPEREHEMASATRAAAVEVSRLLGHMPR